MNKYINFVNEFHEWNALSLEFIDNQLAKHLKENEENQTEIEIILDFLYLNQETEISKIGYKTILEKTEKWYKKLQAAPTQVRDNEMANIGYIKLEKIGKWLTCDSLYNWYVHIKKLNTVKDSVWRIYKGMWLFNFIDVCDINDDGKFRLYDDIKWVVAYEKLTYVSEDRDSKNNVSSWDFSRNASSGNQTNNILSWDFARNASSGYDTQNASSGNEIQNASSGNFTNNALSGDFARNASSGEWTQNASLGKYTQNASSWDYTKNASSGEGTYNASSGQNTHNILSWDYTQNASSGKATRSEVNWKYWITADIGIGSKSKWVIGTWIVLAEYKENFEWYRVPVVVKCGQIDGKILKENTWYTLKNWEFTETE